MAKQHISEGLKRFLREQVQTVFRLEVLLLLHRNRSRSFTAADVAHELGFDSELAQQQLTQLTNIGLLESNIEQDNFKYGPVDAELRSMVDQLAPVIPANVFPFSVLFSRKLPTAHASSLKHSG